ARLDAWIDFNRDGDFSDAAEQIFTGVPVVPGVNTLAFTVPANAQEGPTFARFRLSRQGGLKPSGPAPDGEVEDYSPRITAPPVDECNTTCKGTDFWLAFPANYAPDPDNPLRLTLCILGPQGTTGTVDFQGRGLPISFTIGASMSAQVSLPASLDLGDAIDVVTNKGIHVTASAPVSVYAESHARYTTDGYLALPSTVLGRAYVVQGFGNVHDDAFDLAGSQFAIVACETNTRVLILPSVAAAGRAAGAVYEINLDAGQTYQLRTTNGAPADLSGTLIVADKPIGVFGSHRCAQIPSSNVFFCDYIVEQLLPVTTWGQNFVTLPLATRVNGDTFRIFAAALDTKVFVNGVQVADIDAGQFHQLTLTAGAHITADKPVGVMQYANSADFDPQPFDQGDPFMVIVPPTTMYSTNHMICTAPEDFTAHYLNIVAPAAAVGGVRVDGVIVPAAQFSPIAASGYSGARVAIAAGVHQVTAPLPVSVTVYGWAEYDSYGWPGCLFFGDTTPPTLTCPPAEDTIVIQPGTAAACAALVPDYRDKTRAEDNCSSANGIRIEQSPAPGTPIGGGVHEVRITATDARGNVATCIVTLTVIDPSDPTIQCPQRVVVPCRNPDGEKVTYSVTGRTTCGTPLPVVCDPPPGSLFPPGDTLVTCVTTNALGKMARCEFVVTVRCLKIEPGANGGWNITWTGGGTLETTSQVNGRWTPLANARSPFRLDPSGRQQFFRVRYDD
ncbi:MAG TPA: GEVED domain-containing protein, partial [Methylomirabilota bacterium]|nr:GEVED domain-containing protein [Methylomirabilota bacterium]